MAMDVVDYQIKGVEMQFVELELDPLEDHDLSGLGVEPNRARAAVRLDRTGREGTLVLGIEDRVDLTDQRQQIGEQLARQRRAGENAGGPGHEAC